MQVPDPKHLAFGRGSGRRSPLRRVENVQKVHILDAGLFDHRESWVVVWCGSCGPVMVQGDLVIDRVGRSSLHRLTALTLRLSQLVPIPSECLRVFIDRGGLGFLLLGLLTVRLHLLVVLKRGDLALWGDKAASSVLNRTSSL